MPHGKTKFIHNSNRSCRSRALRHTRDNAEKESAFRGFCALIQLNPLGLAKGFAIFCDAVVNFQRGPNELFEMFHRVLHGYKAMSGDQWPTYFETFPAHLKARLRERYGL